MHMLSAIPYLPARDVETNIPFYRDVLGFTMRHHDKGFAIFTARRDRNPSVASE